MLYDLSRDPEELRPIERERPEVVEEMMGQFAPWQRRMRDFAGRHDEGGEARLTEEEVERLRALGYLSEDGETNDSGAAGGESR